MFRTKLTLLIAGFMVALLLSFPAYAQNPDVRTSAIKTVADPALDNILNAIKNDDFASFMKNSGQYMKEDITQEKFSTMVREIKEEVGEYQSRQWMGFVEKKSRNLVVIYWKGQFSKTSDDMIIQLILEVSPEGTYKVAGFGLK